MLQEKKTKVTETEKQEGWVLPESLLVEHYRMFQKAANLSPIGYGELLSVSEIWAVYRPDDWGIPDYLWGRSDYHSVPAEEMDEGAELRMQSLRAFYAFFRKRLLLNLRSIPKKKEGSNLLPE
jgi:hypothetical protein